MINKTIQPEGQEVYEDEIDFRELFRIMWAGKWLIGAITFSTTLLALIIALLLPNIYYAEARLAPKEQDGAGGLSSLAAQYGGLASLAGINLGSQSTDKTAVGLEVLKSRRFISEFISRHDLLVPLIAAKGWDSETGDLKINDDDYDVGKNEWIRDVSPPKKTIPSLQEAYEDFMDILSVEWDKKSGFVSVGLEHYSPTIAKQWVDWLISDLNASIMHEDVAEAEQAIAYLNQQIINTSVADLRTVFYRLIEDQMKTVMLAKVTDEYLFKTLDPAVAPEKKAKPKRLFYVIFGALFGGVLGLVAVGILHRNAK